MPVAGAVLPKNLEERPEPWCWCLHQKKLHIRIQRPPYPCTVPGCPCTFYKEASLSRERRRARA